MILPDGVAEHAPAKINLALHILGRGTDGYHAIESLSVFTAFGDRITVQHAERDAFEITGEFAVHVPTNAGNLVLRSRDAMRRAFHALARPVTITLEKNIPVESGVGGGSSDAAATMRALAKLEHFDIPLDELGRLGLPLGADVPMCIHARPLIARGIGQIVETIDDFPALAVVLVNPRVAVSTPRVFGLLRRRENPPLPPLPTRPSAGDLLDWLRGTRNDLYEPAARIAPCIAETINVLQARGARFARMSGSGATCYGLFCNDAEAEAAARAIRVSHPDWFVTATTTTASARAKQAATA